MAQRIGNEPAGAPATARAARLAPAVLRACDILDLLAASDRPLAPGAIAKVLGMPRNSTYELVRTLAAKDLIQATELGRYRLGLHLFEIGNAFTKSLDLAQEGRLAAERVVAQCNETTHVGVLDGFDIVYLVKAEGANTVRMVSSVGGRVPAHAAALGKAILAALDRDAVLRRYEGVSLRGLTRATITDLQRLCQELDASARRGYAVDTEESSVDVCCVGAPVFNSSGTVTAGMSIAVPTSRMSARRRKELGVLVTSAAAELSAQLGARVGQLRSLA